MEMPGQDALIESMKTGMTGPVPGGIVCPRKEIFRILLHGAGNDV